MVKSSDIIKNMGIILNQNEKRSGYQDKLAAELKDRTRKRSLEPDSPDGVEDMEYIKGTRKTDRSGLINIVVGVVALAAVLLMIYLVSKK